MYTASDPTQKPDKDKEQYRDKIASINEKGKRAWVYAKKPSGRFTNARTIFGFILLGFLFAGPFIKVNGHPLLLLNVIESKFILFGLAFWPQDFHLVVLAVLTLIVFIVLFTAIFGRVWCGWACPQTVFMEMVFRKIEYFIEGDFNEQKKLAQEPWHAKKIFKKTAKIGVFFAISFLIANTFLAYIIGIDELKKIVTDPIKDHLAGFISINIFTFVFFMVFARFREQVCHFACPYGRFQSVLIDNSTIGVTYDFKRGESRAKLSERRKAEVATSAGDCVDCGMCVRVCPAGIDIRNGIQLECIQCTACIDACDKMMDGIDKPRGLIRYTSYNGVTEGYKLKLNFRIIGYSTVLVLLLSVFFTLLITRPDSETTILRQRGALYQQIPSGEYTNLYTYKSVNKTFNTLDLQIKLIKPANGRIEHIMPPGVVEPQSIREGRFFVALRSEMMQFPTTTVEFGVYLGDKLIENTVSTFAGPEKPEIAEPKGKK